MRPFRDRGAGCFLVNGSGAHPESVEQVHSLVTGVIHYKNDPAQVADGDARDG